MERVILVIGGISVSVLIDSRRTASGGCELIVVAQCMWHSTEKVGMGKARSKNGGTYVVARYTPQGNMGGEKPF